MASIRLLRPTPSLGPNELHVAVDAFEAALRALPGPVGSLAPHRVREVLARYISERAFMGERDADTLRDGALQCLGIAAKQAPSGSTIRTWNDHAAVA
jgi:hypothetical protein